MKHSSPIVLPESLLGDKAVRNLITQWRNLHLRHTVCRKRIPWSIPKASELEKKRRREAWEIVARILEIEHILLVWCARATKHPQIYSSKRGTRLSQLTELQRKYHRNRRIAHNAFDPRSKGFKNKTEFRAAYREERKVIVAEIRAIVRSWMSAIYIGVYPEGRIPHPLPLHPAELTPRKLQRARQSIKREVAA